MHQLNKMLCFCTDELFGDFEDLETGKTYRAEEKSAQSDDDGNDFDDSAGVDDEIGDGKDGEDLGTVLNLDVNLRCFYFK